MFENIIKFLKKLTKQQQQEKGTPSKDLAKERLHLVLMQDRANVSADFLELMKKEIIDVIKKYIEVEDSSIDVRLTNKVNEDGTTGAPFLYANIPVVHIKNEMNKEIASSEKDKEKEEEKDVKKNEKIEKDKTKKDSTEPKKVEDNKEDKKEKNAEYVEEKKPQKDKEEDAKKQEKNEEKNHQSAKADNSQESSVTS